jgi:hypothetical protein
MGNNKMTELCDLANKYRTDKANNGYTKYYYELFKDRRNTVKKVLEFGIGSPRVMNHIITNYITGASLRMWRDFFPHAIIHGVDIDENCMFENERIVTHICDEVDKGGVTNLIKKIGSDIDLIIDDARHHYPHQLRLFFAVEPFLTKDSIYIIEDVTAFRLIAKRLWKAQYRAYRPDNLSLMRVTKC